MLCDYEALARGPSRLWSLYEPNKSYRLALLGYFCRSDSRLNWKPILFEISVREVDPCLVGAAMGGHHTV